VVANRRLKITISCYQIGGAGTGDFGIVIREGSTQLAAQGIALAGSASAYTGREGSVTVTPSAGAHTYKFSTFTTASAASVIATGSVPAFIRVEDVGPATATPD